MNDQCRNCVISGDWDRCKAETECKKDDWIVRHLTCEIERLNSRVAELEQVLDELANDKGNDKWGAVDMRVIARKALGRV